MGGVDMVDRRRINVTIDGHDFAVVSSEEDDYIKDLAKYVDKKIKIISSNNTRLSQVMSATLAALHIADELFKINESYYKLETEAKDPMEKYDEVNKELREANIKIKSYENLCSDYQENIVRYSSQKERLSREIKEYEKNLEEKNKEIEELSSEIEILKDNNFQNQLELVEVKKELADYLRLLDKETSSI